MSQLEIYPFIFLFSVVEHLRKHASSCYNTCYSRCYKTVIPSPASLLYLCLQELNEPKCRCYRENSKREHLYPKEFTVEENDIAQKDQPSVSRFLVANQSLISHFTLICTTSGFCVPLCHASVAFCLPLCLPLLRS